MDRIDVKNIFAAVFDKSILDPLIAILDPEQVKFWGTEGTVKYLKSKGFSAKSVAFGFDFDGRVKTLDRVIFARILADRSKKRHLAELRNVILEGAQQPIGSKKEILSRSLLSSVAKGSRMIGEGEFEPVDLVIVDLYAPDKKNFPESMDIGGQALIRASVKNFKNVAVAFDAKSIRDLCGELVANGGSVSLRFRKGQAKKATRFIADRSRLEAVFLND